jgi:hypothetical protein
MTCTYDLTANLGKLRLAIGDTDCTDAEFSDEELQVLLDISDSWQEAALRACDFAIAKYAKSSTDMRMGPRSESRSQRVEHWRALKADLAESFDITLLRSLGSEDLAFSWTAVATTDDYSQVT